MKTLRIFVSDALRNRVIGFYGFLGCFNAAAWMWGFLAFYDKPVLLGTAFLAYTFGLRHAVDADHIAAIDNVTRKLMQKGKRPLSVGFFFSLGHSTIVVIASLVVYLTAALVATQLETVKSIGGVVGTSISAFFLIAIALANVVILRGIWQNFREVRKGGGYTDQGPDMLMGGGGIMARIFRGDLRAELGGLCDNLSDQKIRPARIDDDNRSI
jgi:nickel/cobalt transporter (NiCoT) family protein